MYLRMALATLHSSPVATYAADAVTVAAYVLLGLAFMTALRSTVRDADVGPVLDGIIFSLVISTTLWVSVISPWTASADLGSLDGAMMFGCLVGDILLLWLGLTAVMSDPAGARPVRPLLMGCAGILIANELHALGHRVDTGQFLRYSAAATLVSFAVFAVSLGPRVPRDSAQDHGAEALMRLRIVGLVASAVSAPIIITLQVRSAGPIRMSTLIAILVATVLLISLRVFEMFNRLQRAQQELVYQATHDELTGVFNRVALLERLESLSHHPPTPDKHHAALYIDLDGFKTLNDTHGHGFGDDVLRIVATRLDGALHGHEMLARIGGDEFVAVAQNVTSEASLDLAERLLFELGSEFEVDGTLARVGASVGIALASNDQTAHLLECADRAMYEAKASRFTRIVTYDQHLANLATGRASIRSALREALANNELVLHYQPIVSMTTGRLASVEALVRWERPGHGLVFPDNFIPVAEESDLVADIDRWVIREALSQLAVWSNNPQFDGIDIHINMSGQSLLAPGAAAEVASLLESSPRTTSRLCFEITETSLPANFDKAAATARELSDLGISIAIDDFGTGFSSLTYLRRLEPDLIKIDRSFVEELDDSADRSIVELIIGIGSALGLDVVAEGVETAAQMSQLAELGCAYAQGYYLSQPCSVEELGSWAETHGWVWTGEELRNSPTVATRPSSSKS